MEPLFALRVVLRAWLLPPGSLIVLALLGLALARRWPRIGRGLAVGSLLTLLALSLPIVADPLTRALLRYPPLEPAAARDAQAIVVLSGGTRKGPPGAQADELTPVTLERLAYGARLSRVTGLPLLLSGGVVTHGEPEAVVLGRVLERDFGVQARWLETRSRNTTENALESAALLRSAGVRHVLLVTSATHMVRAMQAFDGTGLAVIAAPAPEPRPAYDGLTDWLPTPAALQRSTAALYELLGLIAPRSIR